MNITGIIPARFASSRLMGKPLANIGGKPMIQWTWESAKKSRLLNNVIIAVDDTKVYDVVKAFGAEAVMTPTEVPTGSDRIAMVAKNLEHTEIVVNIQGDEPFIPGRMIDEAIEPLLFDESIHVSTLAKKIMSVDEYKSSSIPKVVFDYNNMAMYFSRSPIPAVREAKNNLQRIQMADCYKHIGLYVYRKDALLKFTQLEPTDLEAVEKLEQLRMLEHGMRIKIVTTEMESLSVDTQKDLEQARMYYERYIKEN